VTSTKPDKNNLWSNKRYKPYQYFDSLFRTSCRISETLSGNRKSKGKRLTGELQVRSKNSMFARCKGVRKNMLLTCRCGSTKS